MFVAVVERWRDGWHKGWCGDLGDAVWRRLGGLAGGSTTLWLPRVSWLEVCVCVFVCVAFIAADC